MTVASTVTADSIPKPREDSLYQVRLLSALRSGDPARIHPFLAEIGKDPRKSTDSEINRGAAALHLAIRCATCDTVHLLLSHRAISPNAIYPTGSGTTPLHLAASLSRSDVVSLLLDQEQIDDTLRDSNGKTCLEVAKGKDTIHTIKDSRAFLTASYRSLLRTYIFSHPSERLPPALTTLLSSPRSRHIDLSYLDDASGTSILHEAARRKDIRAIELAITAGADVFVRDRKGRTVYESAGKDDRVKAFLRQYTNQDISLIEAPSTEAPEHKGYLNKYTNVARGYSPRWFVLRRGILSYYRHQEDEGVACRGSISMKTAVLKSTPGTGGLRFEVQATPTRGHAQKWYMKANHPVEASRWLQALTKSIDWAKKEGVDDQGRKSGDSDTTSFGGGRPASTRGSTSMSSVRSRAPERLISGPSSNGDDEPPDVGSLRHVNGSGSGGSVTSAKDVGSGDEGKETEDSSLRELEQVPPYSNSFELQGNTTLAQLELTAQMLGEVLQEGQANSQTDVKKALEESLHTTQGMLTEYVQMVKEREEWWKEELEREHQRQNVWEESLRAVVREGEELEKQLRTKSRRKSRATDSGFVTVSEMGTLRSRPSHLALHSPPLEETSRVESPATISEGLSSPPQVPFEPPEIAVSPPPEVGSPPPSSSSRQASLGVASPTMAATINRHFSLIMGPSPAKQGTDIESVVDTDEEDEFFDAIEANTLPNLLVTDSLILPPSLNKEKERAIEKVINREQYVGYESLRSKLGIRSDDRPPMSLWAVLKNSIGKDLTKISFPVFFNEPTSMLQRMAEDMEFTECLDAAAAEPDPHRRIAFVAAFAMSNYSSTIGRIAKPFNPMLGETFEYVRLDKEYRYVSEQVSHHPPISACWAESSNWRYYGEVDAQNKFMGKSFEIRPTGVAHADLLLPEERAPDYPKAKGAFLSGKVVEHYSWKKVTTNISGFILGSPTIDHYGDMIVTNHRTGDQCVLTFKPRGWRGRDAFEISGYVMDVHGTVTYEIAGRWNSQLVAREVGTGVGHLHPDVSVCGPSSPSATPEYILLWRNSEKPKAPFNLTPFAITLNDCPEQIMKPYLCPTDCRLRPDQRAFELGRYEHANDLKNKQEDFQRATRRAREEGRRAPHRPRWFTAEKEEDTGERVWTPSRVEDDRLEYWVMREQVWQAKRDGKKGIWHDVDPIFIEDDP